MTFLATATESIGLVLAGRIVSTQLIAAGRRLRITAHKTVLIGGGPLALSLHTSCANQSLWALRGGFRGPGQRLARPSHKYPTGNT